MPAHLTTHAQGLLDRDPELQDACYQWAKEKYPSTDTSKIIARPFPGVWRLFAKSAMALALKRSDLLPSEDGEIDPPAEMRAPEPKAVIPLHQSNGHSSQPDVLQAIAQGLQAMGFAPKAALDEDTVLALVETAIDDAIASGRWRQQITIQVNQQTPKTIDGAVPAWFQRLLRLALARVPALLSGPAGAGKSYAAKLVAKALGLSFHPISLSGGTDEGILIGWLLPVGESGRFEYVPSSFVDAYEHGGLVLLDELDAADPNMLLVVNEALANGHLPLPLRREKPVAERHPDFVCLAAANTHGHGRDRQYAGRNQLDEATLSRFRLGQINTDFDPALEQSLYAADIVTFGHRLRERCRALAGWTRDVSTRDLATAHRLVASGFALGEAWYGYFADWSDADIRKVNADLDHAAMTADLY